MSWRSSLPRLTRPPPFRQREGSVGVYRMADYWFPGSSGPPALVLGYGRLAPKAIEAGVRRLAQELQGAGQTSGC